MRIYNITLSAILVAVAGLVSGCSGGGGGGGSAGLSYTGVTTAAVISNSNAKTLALESFASGMGAGSSAGSSQNVSSTVALVDTTPAPPDVGVVVSRLLAAARTAAQGLVTTADNGGGRTTLVSVQQPITPMSGSCGGTASGTLTIDDVTSDVYASIIFDNYCDAGVTLSGGLSFSLILDTTSTDYGLMTMTFANVQVAESLTNVVIVGSVSFDSLSLTPAVTINILMQSASGRVYKIKDFVMTMTAGTDTTGDYVDVTMTGRLYDPDFGYIDLSTTVPLRVYTTDYWPSAGSYTLTGASNATVTLTANPSGYQLNLDLNGDGIDDGSPVTGIWLNINYL